MTPSGWVFDILLVATLIWLAVRALAEVKLFKAVVLFIAFGLLVALAWVRLSAPDIALAEAAIGAGITGALLLDAAGHMRGRAEPYPESPEAEEACGGDADG
jgi:energy-converting hydrogenase B subunit D